LTPHPPQGILREWEWEWEFTGNGKHTTMPWPFANAIPRMAKGMTIAASMTVRWPWRWLMTGRIESEVQIANVCFIKKTNYHISIPQCVLGEILNVLVCRIAVGWASVWLRFWSFFLACFLICFPLFGVVSRISGTYLFLGEGFSIFLVCFCRFGGKSMLSTSVVNTLLLSPWQCLLTHGFEQMGSQARVLNYCFQ